MVASPVVWFCRVSYAKNPLSLAMRWYEQQKVRFLDDSPDMIPARPGWEQAERSAYTQRVQPALKRLRIALAREGGAEPDGSVLLRYFVVAEHGDRKGRLHHHLVLCFDGKASEVVRKRHLETAFAAMRSNGSARYRQRVAALAFGEGRSKSIPPRDQAPVLRAAYGGQCRFQKLASDLSAKQRVARYVSVYAAKSVAGQASHKSYRLRASERWGYVGADRAVSDAMIALAQEFDFKSVRLAGVNLPRRLYAARWAALQKQRYELMYEQIKGIGTAFGRAVFDLWEKSSADWRSGYGSLQAPLRESDRWAVIAYCVVTGHLSLLERPATFKVFGDPLLEDGRKILARASEIEGVETPFGMSWVLPDGLTVGAWHRSGTGVLTPAEWAEAGFQ